MHYGHLTYLYVRDLEAPKGTSPYLYYVFEKDVFIRDDQAPWMGNQAEHSHISRILAAATN